MLFAEGRQDRKIARYVGRLLRRYRPPRRLLQTHAELRPQAEVRLLAVGASAPEVLSRSRHLLPVFSATSIGRADMEKAIELFLATHPVERVVPIAVEPGLLASLPGALLSRVSIPNPGDGGPAPARRIDLLMIDISARSLWGVRRNFRREKLRLAAPLLGVRWSLLQERAREQRLAFLRRAALTAGLLLVTASAFVVLSTTRADWDRLELGNHWSHSRLAFNPEATPGARNLVAIEKSGRRVITVARGGLCVWNDTGELVYSDHSGMTQVSGTGRYLLVADHEDRQEYALDTTNWSKLPTGLRRATAGHGLEGYLVGPADVFLSLTARDRAVGAELFSLGQQRTLAWLPLPLLPTEFYVSDSDVQLAVSNLAVVTNASLTQGGRLLLPLPRGQRTVWSLWNVQEARQIALLLSRPEAIKGAIGVHEPSGVIATTEGDEAGIKRLCLWSLMEGTLRGCTDLPAPADWRFDLWFAEGGSLVIVPNMPQAAWLYSAQGNPRLETGRGIWWSPPPFPRTSKVLVSMVQGGAVVWDVARNNPPVRLPGFEISGIQGIGIAADAGYLLANFEGRTEIWDLAERSRVASIPTGARGRQLELTVDGSGLAEYGQGRLSVWQIASGRAVTRNLPVPGTWLAIALSARNSLVIWSDNGNVTRWSRRVRLHWRW